MVIIRHEEFDTVNVDQHSFTFPLQEAQPWKLLGLCRGLQQTADVKFFPVQGASTREAKIICGRCPVQTECLNYALEFNEKHGVWGGTTERERRKIRQRGRTE